MSDRFKIILITILGIIIINSNNVFAYEQVTKLQIDTIMETCGVGNCIELNEEYNNMINDLANTNYAKFIKQTGDNTLHVYISTEQPYQRDDTRIFMPPMYYYNINSLYGGSFDKVMTTNRLTITLNRYWYAPNGILNSDKTDYWYNPGTESDNIIGNIKKKPYFEWAGKQIGTTTLENFDENLPCFYPNSFKTNTNSYASFKKIGTLYISEDYTISNIYTSTPIINVYNMSQTQQWTYENYLIFTDKNVVDGMIAYDINIDTNYINTPYIYSIPLISQDKELADDIYINFVLLTKTTEGGGIIVESGDTQLSGDFEKDETTLGDINNTINDIGNKIENKVEDVILGTENESGDREGGLLGGLLDGIKSFFIPEDDYFNNYFNELNEWFSDRLGLLYFPFDLLFDFFGRVTSINFDDQILTIGPYTMPLNDDFELVPKIELDFKTFVENEDIKGVYDIYLIIVDGLIIFGLSQLIRIKYEEVFKT